MIAHTDLSQESRRSNSRHRSYPVPRRGREDVTGCCRPLTISEQTDPPGSRRVPRRMPQMWVAELTSQVRVQEQHRTNEVAQTSQPAPST